MKQVSESVTRLTSGRYLLLLLLWGVMATVNTGCSRPSDEVRGTITMHGDFVNPGDLLVRARPLPGEGADAAEALSVVANATRVPGGDPSRFEFHLEGLQAGVPYRIGIKILNQETEFYSRFAWSSDRDPMVQAGEPDLHFDAYAVLSEIVVLGPAEGREREAWVAADALDFTDPDLATRTFAWRTTLPDVTGGRIQVSLKPFPRINDPVYDPCTNVEDGLIYTVDFVADAVAGEWITLPPINFHALLLRGKEDPLGDPGWHGKAGLALTDPNWDTQTLPKLEAGHPLYVRVLPKRGEEIICSPEQGGVPPEVLLAKIILKLLEYPGLLDPEVSLGTVWYTKPDYGPRPYKGEICYRILKDHKLPPKPTTLNGYLNISTWDILAANYISGVTYNQTAQRGMSFCVPPSADDDDGWLESFTDGFGAVLTGIVDAVGDIVNFTSNLWEEIQDEVVDAAASVIDNFVDCGKGSICRSALETGLEIGLAAMGVPPSLPNFDELTDQGLEYLSAQVASQAGIPSVLTDYAAQEAKDFVVDVVNNMKTTYAMEKLPDWLVPDIRFEPAYLVMELYGRGKNLPYDSAPRVIRNTHPIYAGVAVPLPRTLPKKDIDPPILFPMVLPPNTDGLPPAPPTTYASLAGPITFYPSEYEKSVWNKNVWLDQRYTDGCYFLYLTALSDPGGIYNIYSGKFTTAAAAPCE